MPALHSLTASSYTSAASALAVEDPPLFTPLPAAARSSLLAGELGDYQLLAVDPEQAAQLLAQGRPTLNLSLPGSTAPYRLELEKVNLTAEGFSVREVSTQNTLGSEAVGIHYRGHLADQPHVPVALSIVEGEIYGLIALNEHNLVLGRAKDPSLGSDAYVLYTDDQLSDRQSFSCHTPDTEIEYDEHSLGLDGAQVEYRSNGCVRVYLEVDHDIYLNKGGSSGAAAYVTSAFNQVAALYANIGVNLSISEILVWDQASPYVSSSSSGRLSTFQSHRTSFNGDIGQLLSYGASGGIAVLNGLCHSWTGARMSFASIGTTFQAVPTYSWTVMVMAHELGHQLGSQHTHACVWNGNGTAIDGCPGYTEGNCAIPGLPSGGGNIMSYCHISQAGISFQVGFGQQPAAVIINAVNQAACLSNNTCGSGGGPGNGGDSDGDNDNPPANCEANEVYLRLAPDNYGPETRWAIRNESGQVLASGGPYAKMLAGSLVLDTICLPDGCYDFEMLDSYGDGICCQYGNGSIRLKTGTGRLLMDENTFSDTLALDFCLPEEPDEPEDNCYTYNFVDHPPISYGLSQDQGLISVQQGGQQIYLRNNAWKAIEIDYVISPQTVLEFDFRSTRQGEVHGIGFDDNLSISSQYTFRLYGTQAWGRSEFDTYPGDGSWQHFSIPVGQFLAGQADYLFFVADHDNGARNGNSYFRNVRIGELGEGGTCASLTENQNLNSSPTMYESAGAVDSPRAWPNPTSGLLRVQRPQDMAAMETDYVVTALDGRPLQRGRFAAGDTHWQLQVGDLAAGMYVLVLQNADGEYNLRFSLQP